MAGLYPDSDSASDNNKASAATDADSSLIGKFCMIIDNHR